MTLIQALKSLLFIALSFILNSAYAGPVYKWVDEDGQVHYGGKPMHKDAEEVTIKKRYIDSNTATTPLTAKERAENQKRFINALDAENRSIAEAKKKNQQQDEMRTTRCHAARDQLKRQESASALYDLDDKGNRVLLDKEQYDIAMNQARERVSKWCD